MEKPVYIGTITKDSYLNTFVFKKGDKTFIDGTKLLFCDAGGAMHEFSPQIFLELIDSEALKLAKNKEDVSRCLIENQLMTRQDVFLDKKSARSGVAKVILTGNILACVFLALIIARVVLFFLIKVL